jgi:beta-lactamase superfamily II metal-dependent hydrolase
MEDPKHKIAVSGSTRFSGSSGQARRHIEPETNQNRFDGDRWSQPRNVFARDRFVTMKLCFAFAAVLCASFAVSAPAASNDLTAYIIDVEGGQSTLFVTPSGQSVLVDTGWAGFNGRDADRIAKAAQEAGVKQIDYLLITHFHADHVGGVPALAAKLPIKNFVDHGQSVEVNTPQGKKLFDAYMAEASKGNHIVVKPGDKLPIKGMTWEIVSAAGKVIDKALPGGGQPNPECSNFQKRDIRDDENGQSTGSFIQFGKFRSVDLGDLLWNKEEGLFCPVNKIGPVDVYIVSHHGMNMSGSPQMIHALHPKVAIMDNGEKKGGTVEAVSTLQNTPGVDLWMSHYSAAGAKEHNAAENEIANPSSNGDQGFYIKLVAHKNGHFEVTNERNGFTKKY